MAEPASRSAFHIPFEHGAWWAFGSTWAGGVTLALLKQIDPWSVFCAALALAAGFVLQDWAQALIGAILGRRSQALSRWQAPQGWLLAGVATSSVILQTYLAARSERLEWAVLWAVMVLVATLGLAARVLQSGRGRRSLAFSALLLAAPAWPLGVLAFGFHTTALAFGVWPLLYYPAATLAAQSYIRGFPARARWLGSALAGCLGLAAFSQRAWLAGTLLLVNGLLLLYHITRRWRIQPQGMPPGGAIRAFGRTQAGFGVALTLAWIWFFAR